MLKYTLLAASLLGASAALAQDIDFGPVAYERLATRRDTEQRMIRLLQNRPDLTWGEWHILSPFPGDEKGFLGRPLPPEDELAKMSAGGPGPDLGATYTGKNGTTAAWRSLGHVDDRPINLKIHKNSALDNRGTAYLYRAVTSAGDASMTVTMGSDDGLRFWLNAELLVDADVPRGLDPSAHKVVLRLKQGVNHVFCKVTQGQGGWDYQMVTTSPLDSVTDAKLQYALARDFPTKEDEFYRAATIPVPDGIVLEVGGLGVLPDGRAAVSTRRGDVFLVSNFDGPMPFGARFTRFASGMHEALGLEAAPVRPGPGWRRRAATEPVAIYCVQRGELTRLIDTNADGVADTYETVCAAWGVSGNYHEFAFGPKFDDAGNAWVTLNVGFCDALGKSTVPYRGWAVMVRPDGTMEPICSGLRSPNGIGVVPVHLPSGDIETAVFYADNQGDYVGTNRISLLAPGLWAGHPSSLHWRADWKEGDPLPPRQPASIWFPYPKMGQSTADIAVDTTAGKFGPFAGQVFVGDQTLATVMRVYFEKVTAADGSTHYQGACFPFREGLDCGVNRLAFDNQGQLLVGQTDRGWGSIGRRRYGLQRIVWTGKTPFEVLSMRATPTGFVLDFTRDVDAASAADPASYAMKSYTYSYHAKYGSDEMDARQVTVASATVLGPRTVELAVDPVRDGGEGFVHDLRMPGIRDTAGNALLHAEAYYTMVKRPAARPALAGAK